MSATIRSAPGPRYNPAAWYWNVGGSATQVYSSASAGLVPLTDPGYMTFVSLGGVATAIPDLPTLRSVLLAQYPQGLPGGQIVNLLAAGCTIVCTSDSALSATYPLDVEHLFYITSVVASLADGKGLPLGLSTVSIADINGNLIPMTQAQFMEVAEACRDYFMALKTTAAALGGGQSASWPAQPITIA